MKILGETEKYKLYNEFEQVYIRDKITHQEFLLDQFYGDPECGLIDENNKWIIVAGEHLTIWISELNKVIKFENEGLNWIINLKLTGPNEVHLLTDPWNENSAIWKLNCNEFICEKIRNFNNYKGKPYVAKVIW